MTGVEFAPMTVSPALVGPNVDFTLFSISADSQIKAHQLQSRRMLLFLVAVLFYVEIGIIVTFWLVQYCYLLVPFIAFDAVGCLAGRASGP